MAGSGVAADPSLALPLSLVALGAAEAAVSPAQTTGSGRPRQWPAEREPEPEGARRAGRGSVQDGADSLCFLPTVSLRPSASLCGKNISL